MVAGAAIVVAVAAASAARDAWRDTTDGAPLDRPKRMPSQEDGLSCGRGGTANAAAAPSDASFVVNAGGVGAEAAEGFSSAPCAAKEVLIPAPAGEDDDDGGIVPAGDRAHALSEIETRPSSA